MKFILIIILTFLKFEVVAANEKIAFIDLNFIMNNSEAGTSINTFIKNLSEEKNNDFQVIENEIKKDENELISKKNIIEESIYNQKVNEIRKRINDYKLERQNFNKNLNEKKIKFISIKAIFSFAATISNFRNVKIIIKRNFIKKMFQFEI